jgi:anthranilate phosphoribosyltransferase
VKTILTRLVGGATLTEIEAAEAMLQMMEGTATPAQIAAFLTALRLKGETVEEITGMARVMREKSLRVPTNRTPLVDTCGTGGDTIKTFNISTTAAFVLAGAGVAVAKHGNRAVTSKSGSADVLESLGIRLELTPEQVGACVDEIGIGFLFARNHHPAMKYVAPVRAELGIRTIFNALGPLTNPAGATRQVVGVYDPALCVPLARVLGQLGAEHALVVHGLAGLDEICTFGTTLVAEFRAGEVKTFHITAKELGLTESSEDAIASGGDPAENAQILESVLNNTDTGARRDIVLANAAAGLYVAGISSTLSEGVTLAREVVESGAALAKLDALRKMTNQ